MRYCNLDFKSSTFYFIKKMSLPQIVVEYLSFVPVVIMSALWISNLFIQHLGHLPSVNWNNLLASIPTVLAAILTKKLISYCACGSIFTSLHSNYFFNNS